MDKIGFVERLNLVMGMYKREISEAEAQMWCAMLESSGITYGDAVRALATHMMNPVDGKFPPKLADISGIVNGTPNDLEAEALIEFSNMRKGIRKAGVYNDAVFSNHRTNMAIHILGGWREVCSFEQWDEYIGRKMFVDAYKAVCAQPVAMCLPLTGIADFRNVYKFGRTPEEIAECNRLLECCRAESVPSLQTINVKTLENNND